MDGLLLTRRERLRSYGEKTALVAGPSLVVALVVLALGQWVVALVVVAIAGITALGLGSAVRTRLGAAILGLLLAGGIVLFLLAVSWLGSHPIQRED
jgi:small neutral amino acid transporter SnatA (MarC family)